MCRAAAMLERQTDMKQGRDTDRGRGLLVLRYVNTMSRLYMLNEMLGFGDFSHSCFPCKIAILRLCVAIETGCSAVEPPILEGLAAGGGGDYFFAAMKALDNRRRSISPWDP